MMDDKAYKYARNLLFEICRRDCPEKEVEALDDTIGVLTQIDHMTAHLFSRIEALIAERDAAIARTDQFKAALFWCSGSSDFNEGGIAREGWLKVCAPLLKGKSHE